MISLCSKKDTVPVTPLPPLPPPPAATFVLNSITDTYDNISSFAYYTKWSVYNVHDSSIKKFGDYFITAIAQMQVWNRSSFRPTG